MGIYFRNSNAMSPVIRKGPLLGSGSILSYITIGGQLEMYFMFKGTAKEIIKQYQSIIGFPSLPPLYALGWYAGARGYTEFNDDFQNLAAYVQAGIPLEGVFLDHKYMDGYKDFTVDPVNYKDLNSLSTSILTTYGIETVLEIDADLSSNEQEDPFYDMALEEGALIESSIKQSYGFKPLLQKSYAGDVVFLDFYLNPNATRILGEGLTELQGKVTYRGLYIDHDEVSAWCSGEYLGQDC